jgi:hypothetical protein
MERDVLKRNVALRVKDAIGRSGGRTTRRVVPSLATRWSHARGRRHLRASAVSELTTLRDRCQAQVWQCLRAARTPDAIVAVIRRDFTLAQAEPAG